MKKLISGLFAFIMVFTALYGVASAMTVKSTHLQAGIYQADEDEKPADEGEAPIEGDSEGESESE